MPDEAPPAKVFLNVTLNKDGVIAPALHAVNTTAGAVVVALRAIEDADLAGPVTINGHDMTFQLELGESSEEVRRTSYRSWLLTRGFHELVRGLHGSLEEAYLWIELVKSQGQRLPASSFEEYAAKIKKYANAKNLPDLLEAVSSGLNSRFSWEAQALSLNKVRNCLEHRNGIVTERDAGVGATAMQLSVPAIQLAVAQPDGAQLQLKLGMIVQGGGSVTLRIAPRHIEFKVGEPIVFTANDFGEIAFGCWIMAQNLAGNLPLPAGKPAETP
jgi:hypothetical protein